jgi:hypothetical protein
MRPGVPRRATAIPRTRGCGVSDRAAGTEAPARATRTPKHPASDSPASRGPVVPLPPSRTRAADAVPPAPVQAGAISPTQSLRARFRRPASLRRPDRVRRRRRSGAASPRTGRPRPGDVRRRPQLLRRRPRQPPPRKKPRRGGPPRLPGSDRAARPRLPRLRRPRPRPLGPGFRRPFHPRRPRDLRLL